MIRALSIVVVASLAVPTLEQSTPLSPCPNVFEYETSGTEPGRWYGVANLSTDSTLHSLWLNIVLDSKADILGNWIGDVTTSDNIDFKIENTKMEIHPGPATSVRFFVQYNPINTPPKLLAIRLNGREICNAKNRLPAVDIESERPSQSSRPSTRPTTRPQSRPETTQQQRPAERPAERPETSRPIIRPEDRPQTKPVYVRPSDANPSPVYVPTSNPPIDDTNVFPYSIFPPGNIMNVNFRHIVIRGGGSVPAQSVGSQTGRPSYQVTPTPPRRTTARPQDDIDDYNQRPSPEDYFSGERPTFVVPSNTGSNTNNNNYYNNNQNDQDENVCGTVIRNNPNPLVVNGMPTLDGQWPWQIALYQTKNVDNKYICGGTLVSRRHVITAAHCVTLKESVRIVNKNTLTVYLGKHNLRTSVEGVQIRLVGDIRIHPQYNASVLSKDLAILKLRETVQYTEWVRPACLWPDNEVDLRNVVGKKGSVVGWGFDATGVPTEELTLVEMPVVTQETCIRSYSEFFAKFTSDYTFCAGYRNGTSVCNGDSGGGMVFNLQNRWYVRGLVSLSVARDNERRCDPTHYVVFTDLAKFLSWIKREISDISDKK